MAIGSSSERVARLVANEGMFLAFIGLFLGLGAALAVAGVLESMLYEVRPHDPVSFAVAAVLISAVAFLACWLPARRATSVDPATVLRAE